MTGKSGVLLLVATALALVVFVTSAITLDAARRQISAGSTDALATRARNASVVGLVSSLLLLGYLGFCIFTRGRDAAGTASPISSFMGSPASL